MIDCESLLELAEKKSEREAALLFPNKESIEYKEAKARIMHNEYMALIIPPNRCKYCGK